MSLNMGEDYFVPFAANSTDLLAGTSQELIAPVDGFIAEIAATVQAAVGTGGVVKVALGGTPTDVPGASITVADSATKGTRYSALATAHANNRAVSKGDRIQVLLDAAFATSGALNGYVRINTGQ